MTVLRRVGHARRGKASAVALALVFDLLAAFCVRELLVEPLFQPLLFGRLRRWNDAPLAQIETITSRVNRARCRPARPRFGLLWRVLSVRRSAASTSACAAAMSSRASILDPVDGRNDHLLVSRGRLFTSHRVR